MSKKQKILDEYLQHLQETNSDSLNESLILLGMAVAYVVKIIRRQVKRAIEVAKKTSDDLKDLLSIDVERKRKAEIELIKLQIKEYQKNIKQCDKSKNPKQCKQIINQEIQKLKKKLKQLQKYHHHAAIKKNKR